MFIEVAPAKINLTLEIIGKRKDGYHEIRSVMQTIDICDILTFWENPRIQVFPEYENLPPLDGFTQNKTLNYIGDNLVYQAAELLKKNTGHKGGAIIQLRKNIPSATGLGGGSSDAAATLKGLNRLWKLGLSLDELAKIGAELGSDIAFFIYGGTCLATGRGEIIKKLKPIPEKWVLLLSPPLLIKDKTKMLYSLVDRTLYSSGEITDRLNSYISSNGAGSGNQYNGRFDMDDLFNVFEMIYKKGGGIFSEWKDYIDRLGIGGLHLAGSGPTVYYFSDTRDELVEIVRQRSDICKRVATYIARTISDY